MTEIYGNTSGLAPRALKTLERLYRRRVPLERIATPELVRGLAEASRVSKRQVGVLVHRSGNVDMVIVGDAHGLMLPDIGRLRAAQGRFRALRLVHTHLFNEPLTRDDLTDLTRLRLDLVAAVLLAPDGEPRSMTWAYNIVSGDGRDSAYTVEGPFPWGSLQPDFGALILSLEQEFARQTRTRIVSGKDGRAILVHVSEKRTTSARGSLARLDELDNLASTAGVTVADRIVQHRERLDPKFVVGRGKLQDIVLRAIELEAETLIFDCDLTPSQLNGIAGQTDLRVIDRNQLILDIFAQRAESRDGKLQVELAQLKYALPRLDVRDDALSRLTGGIGGRGPGETKLEIGRRRARDRIMRLERELRLLEKQRAQRRVRRVRSEVPVIAIVGYTNAGKSTLLNTLTAAGVLAEDRLFATLDTRARQVNLPGNRLAVLTDTVGFIRDMPKALVAAFRATFEEASDADLLLELVDASNRDHDQHMYATQRLLVDLGIGDKPRIVVFNKIDLLDSEERSALGTDENATAIVATDRASATRLLDRVVFELGRLGRLPSVDAGPIAPELPSTPARYPA